MASVVGQLVVVQTDTRDGLVAAQVIVTLGALLKRNPHRRNTREINVNEGQYERNMPGITAAAFISGNIDTDFTFVIESPLLVTISFAANGTGQGAEILIVHGYAADYHIRLNFIAGDKSSQGNEIPLACVVVRLVGVGLYLKARSGYSRIYARDRSC